MWSHRWLVWVTPDVRWNHVMSSMTFMMVSDDVRWNHVKSSMTCVYVTDDVMWHHVKSSMMFVTIINDCTRCHVGPICDIMVLWLVAPAQSSMMSDDIMWHRCMKCHPESIIDSSPWTKGPSFTGGGGRGNRLLIPFLARQAPLSQGGGGHRPEAW